MTGFAAENLAVLRGERLLFRGLDFTLPAGGALALTGSNGSGKTTLLRLLAGLARPLAGRILWEGSDIAADREAHRARLRYVGHLPGLKAALTPAESLASEARLLGLGRGAAAAATRALDYFALQPLAGLPLRVLSAGQRRRVALARLALAPAALWLLDEPVTSLDAASEARLWQLAREHLAAGGRLAVATHGAVPLAGLQQFALADLAVPADEILA